MKNETDAQKLAWLVKIGQVEETVEKTKVEKETPTTKENEA
jgi:hypothetical protein